MPKPPQMPKKSPPQPETAERTIRDQPGRLPVWYCPVCNRGHYGFSRKVCRNELCTLFGKEASN